MNSDLASDYSAVLGVPTDASMREIIKAIRQEETDFSLKQEAYVYLRGCAVSEESLKDDSVDHEDPFVALARYLRRNLAETEKHDSHNKDYARNALQLLSHGEKKVTFPLWAYDDEELSATGWNLLNYWNHKKYRFGWFDFDALMIENSVGVVKFDLLVKETGEYHCVITIEVHSDFTAEYSSALGVSESATKEEIDEAFQKEKESFKRKQQAYDFLKETAKTVKKVRSEDEDSREQFSAAVDPVVSSDQEFSGDSWCELSDYECETEFFDPSFTLKCHLKEDLKKIENDLKKVENELKSKLPTNYFHGMNDGEIQTCLQLLEFDDREMTLQFWSDREHEVSEGKWKVKYLGCQNFADFQTADGSFYLWIEHSDYSPKFKAVATEHHFFRKKNVNRKVLRSTGDGNRQFVKYKREFDSAEDTESSGSLTDSTVRFEITFL